MSIMIKGMNMPKTCEECEVWSLCHFPKAPKGIGRREPDCPLVEIPTLHGRLAAEFEKNLYEYIDPYEIPGAMQALYDAMKILEAED